MRGSVYRLHDGEQVTVRRSSAEALEVDAVWRSTPAKPPVHLHPHQDERFEVSEGELSVEIEGRLHVVRAGEALEVPRGAVHRMWNGGEAPCRAVWRITPALRTEEFFAAVEESRAHARAARGGTITLLGSGPVLREFADEFRLPLPAPLARPLLAVLAGLARLRGYPSPGAGRVASGASPAPRPAPRPRPHP
jgi:mannose-6-phosphate isomerase-like protein (cupin superfamily)